MNVKQISQVAQAQVEEAENMRSRLDEDRVFESRPSTTSPNTNGRSDQTSKKSTAAIAAEVADKLAASTSSQYIMTSVLSTFAAEEAKNAGLTTSSASTSSLSSTVNNPISASETRIPVMDPNGFMPQQFNPPQNNPYHQSVVVQQQPSIHNSQAHYHNAPPLQYMQPPSGYDYGNGLTMPPGPPPPAPPSYMVSSMVPLMHQQPQMAHHQPSTLPLQQPMQLSQQPPAPVSFRPIQPPGMVYYTHPYGSQ